MAENAAGSGIGTITVVDPDSGDTHTLAVSDARFEIVGNQLKLKAGQSLNYEAEPTVEVTITATDQAGVGLAYNQAFTINVSTVNEAATVALSNATVAENAPGANIGTLTVVDPDAGDTHTLAVSDERISKSLAIN